MEALDRELTNHAPFVQADICPISAAQLVQHAVCFVDAAPFSNNTASSVSIQAAHRVSLLPDRLLPYVTPSRVGHLSDVLALFTVMLMVLRTLFYVKRRRKGLVGPAMAPILLKFWALNGIIECITHILTLYLTPFQGTWLISLLRVIALVFLTYGRKLPNATALYETHLAPFYKSQQPEIEQHLSYLRQRMNRVDDAFKELGSYLLNHMAVGGLSGVANGLSQLFAEALRQDSEASQRGTAEQGAMVQYQTQGGREAENGGMRAGLSSPREGDLFTNGRQFFAGEAEERAKAIGHESSTDSLQSVMWMAKAEPPRVAYEGSRSMRRQFKNRGAHTKMRGGAG